MLSIEFFHLLRYYYLNYGLAMSNETENNRLEKNGNELPSRGRISIEYRYYFSKNVYVLSVATGPMETVQERERERERDCV